MAQAQRLLGWLARALDRIAASDRWDLPAHGDGMEDRRSARRIRRSSNWSPEACPGLGEPTDPKFGVDAALGGDLDGTYRGHADVMEMLRTFWDEFADQRTEIEECIPAGDDFVLGVRFYGRGKKSGVEIDWPAWHVWSFRDG